MSSIKAWVVISELGIETPDLDSNRWELKFKPHTQLIETEREAKLEAEAQERSARYRNIRIVELCPVEEREKAFDEGMDKYHDLCCLVLDYFSEPTDINKRRLIDGAYDKWEQKKEGK